MSAGRSTPPSGTGISTFASTTPATSSGAGRTSPTTRRPRRRWADCRDRCRWTTSRQSFSSRSRRGCGRPTAAKYAVWAAYTQQSNWQIANGDLSRPFRETDYQPELIFTYRPDLEFGGFRWRLLNLGLVHQSNGRAEPLSRSWNRIYAQFGFERDNFALLVRPWYRFKEGADKDDNPDITDYYGYGDIVGLYRTDRGHTFTLTGRGNIRERKGSVEFEWSTPPLLGPFKGYFQVFSGYGESLIDYNWKQTTVGAGVLLNDLL